MALRRLGAAHRWSFAFGGALLPLVEALRMIAANVRPVAPVQSVALDAAVGRIRAEDVVPTDLPPFDNPAVRAADADGSAADLRVAGRVAAGQHPAAPIAPGTAQQILTGAPLPPNADTGFMQEDVWVDPEGRVHLSPGSRRGANTRPRGARTRGENVGREDVAALCALAASPSGSTIGPRPDVSAARNALREPWNLAEAAASAERLKWPPRAPLPPDRPPY